MKVVGNIRQILEPRSGISQRTGEMWVTQDFVLEYFYWPNQTVPSKMLLSIFGADRIQEADLKEGEEVEVRFHIEAEEYQGKMYNRVRYDGINHIHRQNNSAGEPQSTNGNLAAEPQSEGTQSANGNSAAEPQSTGAQNGGDDDVPF